MPARHAAVVLLLASLVCSATSCRAAPATASSPDTDDVRAVVSAYLYGLKHNDVDSLRAAFWPEARLLFVRRDGTLGQLTQPDWYRQFAASAGKEEEGDLRIASVETTRDVAAVKVVETYPRDVYVDYLNLVKVAGRWRIVNKVFTSYRR